MSSRNSRRSTLATLADWVRTRPGPEKGDRKERVKLTPPSDGPKTPFQLAAMIVEDIEAVLENDPAARHALEVVLVYPGLHAVWAHRIAHALWRRGLVTAPRVLAHASRQLTGVEIHPAARLGRRVFIDHGSGVVIGETATVGDDCLLYAGAVLGGTSTERKERHPTLGKGVVVGTHSCVLGPIQLGDGAKVGSNSVVVRDVPADATVVGVPGRTVQDRHDRHLQQLDHANLPDPVAKVLSAMLEEIEELRRKVASLEGGEVPSFRAGRAHEGAEFREH